MAGRDVLTIWVHEALIALNGSGSVLEVAKKIWELHQNDLADTELFYTWQYDYRWAATKLRKDNIMKSAEESPTGIWELNK